MSHWPVVPIVLPLMLGALLVLLERLRPSWLAPLNIAGTLALLATALFLLAQASAGTIAVYLLGNWQAPFGIVLVLDRLAALMLCLTSFVALVSLTYALRGWSGRGAYFHALFQLQLMGLNGAFLTGDLFNLFVFFEVLLIASYGLLLHGGGVERLRNGFYTVVINLAGSAFFLLAASMLYGLTGTLNIADMARKIVQLAPADVALARAAALLLLVVFGLKAAALPLNLWVPGSYAAACAPVAAFFAVLTKVGVYSVMRVYVQVFGADAGSMARLAEPVLLPIALATLAVAAIGALAATHLRHTIGCLVIGSAATLLMAVALSTPAALAGALYYLVHSTLAAAALFLLAELIRQTRGAAGDSLRIDAASAPPRIMAALFFVAAISVAGLPPLSGFVGKLSILSAALDTPHAWIVLSVVLSAGLLIMIALLRAGSRLFWRSGDEPAVAAAPGSAYVPVGLLLAGGIAMSVFAAPLQAYATAAAAQLTEPRTYINQVLNAAPLRKVDGRSQ